MLPDFPEELGRRWTESLLAMRYDDPCWRPLMDKEGLRQWIRSGPDEVREGYRVLLDAIDRQGLARQWRT